MDEVRIAVLELVDAEEELGEFLADLASSPQVAFAEPDYMLYRAATPDDPKFAQQWSLSQPSDRDIDAPEAWDRTLGDPETVVAVLDGGIDVSHPDVAPNLWTNPGEIENGLDDDGNGYVDDVHGINCITRTADLFDLDGHGTHVAGTIGAVQNNGVGIAGVSPQVRLMPLRFLGLGGAGSTSDAIVCLEYLLTMKTQYGVDVRVVNASWGGSGYSQALRDAIQALADAEILFVAAAGNDGNDNDEAPHYPSSFDVPNVVAVTASDRDDQLASFSSYGSTSVDLAAPGVDILSTIPGGAYTSFSGSSMATAHVTGAAVLALANAPLADAVGVKALLLANVDRVAELGDKVASGGRLNASKALCSPGDQMLLVEPQFGFRAGLLEDMTVRAWIRDCGEPVAHEIVRVMPFNGDPMFWLADDGVFPDEVADDGLYSATYRPSVVGEVWLRFEALTSRERLLQYVRGSVVETTQYVMRDDVPFDWIDATAGQRLPIYSDESQAYAWLGFDFPFYGEVHSAAQVSSNGYLTFGPDALEVFNLALPNSAAPANLIAPYWDDLAPNGGAVYSLREGTAPNRRLTIQWDQFGYFGSVARVTFQVTLYELDGRIVFRYLDVTSGEPAVDRGASATVGIQNGTAEFGRQFASGGAALSDEMALEFSPNDANAEAVTWLISGQNLIMYDPKNLPSGRSLYLSSYDPGIVPPDLGGKSDPTRWGATLRVTNPETGEEDLVVLPASGWYAVSGGFYYSAPGACSSALLISGRLQASCFGAALGFTLQEPAQGALSVMLEVGSKTAYCALFGGNVTSDFGIGFGSTLGRFIAYSAPVPASCPIAPGWL